MESLLSGNSFLVLLVLVFVALMLLFEGGYLFWSARKGSKATKLNSRLHAISAVDDHSARTKVLKDRLVSELPIFDRFLRRLPRTQRLDQYILQSGVQWTVSRLLFMSLGAGAAALMFALQLQQPVLFSVTCSFAAACLPWAFVHLRRSKRLSKIEVQLPDALDLMTRALRAGHAFSAALKMAGEEMSEPIAGELRMVHDEVNYGFDLAQALTNLSERVPLTDMRYFVVAVIIQRDSGGNLTEILTNLSGLIRERLKLLAKVKVLTSEGRLSAWILFLMPFFLAGVMSLTNPKFIGPLWTDPIGVSIVRTMLVLMAIGAIMLRSIVKIRV
jgi:tight adherence protein B